MPPPSANDHPPAAASPPPLSPRRVGLYGGTFDPVHLGHLILARDAVELLTLDRLVFIPARVSPHKLARQPGVDAATRLAMLRGAVADEPRFDVDPCELGRDGPSYTVDTLRDLRGRLPADTAFFYLIGEDNVPELSTWHRIDEVRALATFVVFRRGTDRSPTPSAAPAAPAETFPTLPRRVDISSTEIRKRVAAGLPIQYLVPAGVAETIAQAGLYRPPVTAAPPTNSSPEEPPPLPPNS